MSINIIVDGTMGVGKTSLIKLLTEEFGYIAYSEIFRDDHNLLGRFFTEGNRWCFPMQLSFSTTVTPNIKKLRTLRTPLWTGPSTPIQYLQICKGSSICYRAHLRLLKSQEIKN